MDELSPWIKPRFDITAVRDVKLLKKSEPEIQLYLDKVISWSKNKVGTTKLEERKAEREKIEKILGIPFKNLLSKDSFTKEMGKKYSWILGTRYPFNSAKRQFEKVMGFGFSGSRWEAHARDLEESTEFKSGFKLGIEYETRIRSFIAEKFNVKFIEHRWLKATEHNGKTHYFEVDGIEKLAEKTALVYEIKHGYSPGCYQLLGEYIPLLKIAFPKVQFFPIEINDAKPTLSLINYYSQEIKRSYGISFKKLVSLDGRSAAADIYQYVNITF